MEQPNPTWIHNALIDPLLSIDPSGRIENANPAVESVFGWKPAELIGRDISVLMPEPFHSEHQRYIDAYFETGVAKAIGRIRKVLGLRKNGEEFPCELSVSEIRDGDDVRFVGVVRDISEREDLMTRLAQAERLAAVGELAAGVAHEVNNPINTIINCAQLLKDGDEDPSLFDDILQEGLRIAGIVRDLLDFARDRGSQPVVARIDAVIARTLSLVSRRIERRGIVLTVDIPDDLPSVMARTQQLQQVLLNLLLNARDALSNDGRDHTKRIRVFVDRGIEDGTPVLRVHVADNGTGIDPINIDRIFQPFFTTKRDRGGTGLGLSVSHGIVRSHGGRLWVASKPGDGAEFVFSLPLAEAE